MPPINATLAFIPVAHRNQDRDPVHDFQEWDNQLPVPLPS